MADCNIEYTVVSDFAADLKSIFEDIKKGPIVTVEVEYTVECVEDEGCVDSSATCAWGPYTKKMELDIPLRKIFNHAYTDAAEDCLSCIDDCATVWLKGLCLGGCIEDECLPYIKENGGDIANVIDNDKLSDIFQEAVKAEPGAAVYLCGCPKGAPDQEGMFQIEKSIKAYFDNLCKRELA